MQFTDIAESKLNSSHPKLNNVPLMAGSSVIRGVGSAFPEKKYTQNEVKQLLGINNPTVHKLLRADHIQNRHLYLPEPPTPGMAIIEMIDFASLTLSDQHEAMRFEWNELQKKWSFCLSKQIPFVVGDNIIHPIKSLLEKNNLNKEEIAHWAIHTGGAAVIDGVIRNLKLTEWDLRHTRSVLRDYGNITSGSFLVSLERLLGESQAIKNNDLGIFAAMGPGATLEVGLVRYHL